MWDNSFLETLNDNSNILVQGVLIFISSFVTILFIHRLSIARLVKLTKLTKNKFDDLIVKIFENLGWPVFAVIAFYITTNFVPIPSTFWGVSFALSVVIISFYTVKSVQEVIAYTVVKALQKDKSPEANSLSQLISIGVKSLVWTIALIIVLQNLGINVNALIGTLGVGSIAIAFSLQNVMTDLFSSLSLYVDQPFVIGDFVEVDGNFGTVQKVGFRSTRIKTLQGEEMIFANKDIVNTRINNYNRFERRRVSFMLGFTYNTPNSKLKAFPKAVSRIFDELEIADFDRCHWFRYGASSLDFEIVYHLNSPDYGVYMDLQHKINLDIKEYCESEGIEFAFPTQSLYFENSLKTEMLKSEV